MTNSEISTFIEQALRHNRNARPHSHEFQETQQLLTDLRYEVACRAAGSELEPVIQEGTVMKK